MRLLRLCAVAGVGCVALLLAGCQAEVAAGAGSHGWSGFSFKLIIASIVGFVAIVGASVAIFKDDPKDLSAGDGSQPGLVKRTAMKVRVMSHEDPKIVGLVIAFDTVIFIVVGWVFLVAASWRWETASLSAGACLLAGGLVGLLFGMPLAVDPGGAAVADTSAKAQQAADKRDTTSLQAGKKADDLSAGEEGAQEEAPAPSAEDKIRDQQADASKAKQTAARAKSQTLLSESASTLSKLLAGAGLVEFRKLFDMFLRTAAALSRSIDPGTSVSTLGCAVILYFGLVGFLSGLFLPAYFMKGWQDSDAQ